MPLVHFFHEGSGRLGKLFGKHVVDLANAAPQLPGTIIEFLSTGEEGVLAFKAVIDDPVNRIPLNSVRLLPPVPKPEKFLGIGMNYRDHVEEASQHGVSTTSYQLWFNKQVSCINGPFDDVEMPAVSRELDYEAELAVVIGKSCRHVPAAYARSVIAGYMVANDVSVRDWQMRTPTHTLGKSFDTHGPIGPWLVLDYEIEDPHALDIRMFVNGELRQSSNTSYMIHNIYEQIAYLSTVMTLRPGDVLATGTPAGVGFALDPPRFLEVGDVMRVEIDGIGFIENTVVAERTRSGSVNPE